MAFSLPNSRDGTPRKPTVETGAIERKDGPHCDQCGGRGKIRITPRAPCPARDVECPKCRGSGGKRAKP